MKPIARYLRIVLFGAVDDFFPLQLHATVWNTRYRDPSSKERTTCDVRGVMKRFGTYNFGKGERLFFFCSGNTKPHAQANCVWARWS